MSSVVRRFEGKVALVTGAARGQGRSHAVSLAREGADIIAVDICRQIDTVPYPMSKPEDLAITVAEIESLDRRVIGVQADVRDATQLSSVVADAVGQLGGLDIVCANAGIASVVDQLVPADVWRDMIDVNLTGVWYTCFAAIPHLRAGGSIVITSSVAGVKGFPGCAHYSAAKHGVIGLARSLARELAPQRIRVNVVCPTNVLTPMIDNEFMRGVFRPDIDDPKMDDTVESFRAQAVLPEPWVEPIDISNAILYLCSDAARYVTGIVLPVDLGALTM